MLWIIFELRPGSDQAASDELVTAVGEMATRAGCAGYRGGVLGVFVGRLRVVERTGFEVENLGLYRLTFDI